jgi:hypothetical protein
LKPKGYLKQTSASVGKVHQPRITQVNANIPAEEQTLKENFKQFHYVEASTSKPKVKLETPEVIVSELKFEIDQTNHILIPTIIYSLSIIYPPKVKFYVSRNLEDYFLYPDSSPVNSPIYT